MFQRPSLYKPLISPILCNSVYLNTMVLPLPAAVANALATFRAWASLLPVGNAGHVLLSRRGFQLGQSALQLAKGSTASAGWRNVFSGTSLGLSGLGMVALLVAYLVYLIISARSASRRTTGAVRFNAHTAWAPDLLQARQAILKHTFPVAPSAHSKPATRKPKRQHENLI